MPPTTRPSFRNPDDRARVEHSGLRRRLIEGAWGDDASTRHRQFFSAETAAFLPPPELSHNAFCLFVDAKSTLYDEPPHADAKGVATDDGQSDPLAVVVTPELWALCQENLRLVNALNEGFMRADCVGGRVTYRVVPADCVGDVVTLPSRPDRPVALSEIRPRSRLNEKGVPATEYTLETWDVRDPTQPVFRIEALRSDGAGGAAQLRDVTTEYIRDEQGNPAMGYPYLGRTDGTPIFPYVQYHAKVSNTTWNAWAGMEVVEGTLNASALWTFWMMGMRDGAHPQRYTIDLDVDGMTVAKPDGSAGTGYVQMIPTAVLRFKTNGDKSGSAGQFQPAMDPKTMGESITDFEAALGRFAGIDAPDVQRSAGSSGYALVIADSGKRKAQRRLEVPCRMADTLLLATAARLANTVLGTSLPESEADWSIQYSKARSSTEEIKAAYEEAQAMVALGVWDEVDVQMHLSPGMSREQAVAKVISVRETRAMLATVGQPTATSGSGAEPPPATTS